MGSLLPVLVLVGNLAAAAPGGVSAPEIPSRISEDRWKIDFKLGLAEANGKWVFSVGGVTNLPAETVLRARVYVLDLVNDPAQGPREDDDEALVREDDGTQAPCARFTAGSGRIQVDVHAFQRKPYSIRYRAKIEYRPDDQTEPLRLRVGDEGFLRKADLRVGSDDSYQAELKERLAEATGQLESLEKLGLELSDLAFGNPRDAAAWSRWRGPAVRAIDALLEENRRRFPIWAVWIEGQSRMRVGALGQLLEHLIEAVEGGEALREPDRIRMLVRGYQESIEEACDAIGADVPLSPLKSGPALAAYDRAIAPLRGPRPSLGVLRSSREGAVTALLDLTAMLRLRRRGYPFLAQMAAHLDRLSDLIRSGAPPPELDQALGELDAAEREFKAFARLP